VLLSKAKGVAFLFMAIEGSPADPDPSVVAKAPGATWPVRLGPRLGRGGEGRGGEGRGGEERGGERGGEGV
jgi:hypothetical protein